MISLFQKSRWAVTGGDEQVEVLGVTKGDDGVSLWVVRRVLDTGESVMRCYEHVAFPTEERPG
jgi:hypothetical protein